MIFSSSENYLPDADFEIDRPEQALPRQKHNMTMTDVADNGLSIITTKTSSL